MYVGLMGFPHRQDVRDDGRVKNVFKIFGLDRFGKEDPGLGFGHTVFQKAVGHPDKDVEQAEGSESTFGTEV